MSADFEVIHNSIDMKCKARTATGSICKKQAVANTEYCKVHTRVRKSSSSAENEKDKGKSDKSAAGVPDTQEGDTNPAKGSNRVESSLAKRVQQDVVEHSGVMDAISLFLELQREYSQPRQRTQKILRRSFVLRNDTIEGIDSIARTKLLSLGDTPVKFEASLGFKDSIETFDNTSDLFSSTTGRPISLKLQWEHVLQNPICRNCVTLDFKTEECDLEHLPEIDLYCGFFDKESCVAANHLVMERLEATKVPSLFRWLEIFRNPNVCYWGGWATAVLLLMIGFTYSSVILDKFYPDHDSYWSESAVTDRMQEAVNDLNDYQQAKTDIVGQSTLDAKFDALLEYFFAIRIESESESIDYYKKELQEIEEGKEGIRAFLDFDFIYDILRFFGPYLFGYAGAMVGFTYIPIILRKLAPRSGIAIGDAAHSYLDWENTFKFMLFSLIVGGLLIPLLRSFFW